MTPTGTRQEAVPSTSPRRRRGIIAAYVLLVVLTVAVLVWFSVLLLLHGSVELVPRIVTTGAMTLLITVPIALGSIVIGWRVDPRSPEGRRSFIRLMLVGLVIELFSGALLIGAAVASNASVFWPIVVAVVSLLLTATGVAFAEAVRRATQRRVPRRTTLDGFTPEDVRKKIRAIVLTVVVTVCAAGLFILAVVVSPGWNDFEPIDALNVVPLVLLAGTMSCFIVTRKMPFQIRAIFGGDAALQRRVTRSVLKGIPNPEDDSDTELLYSRLMAVYLPFQYAQLATLSLAILTPRVVELLSGSGRFGPWLNVVLVTAYVALALAILPPSVKQHKRIRERVLIGDRDAQASG